MCPKPQPKSFQIMNSKEESRLPHPEDTDDSLIMRNQVSSSPKRVTLRGRYVSSKKEWNALTGSDGVLIIPLNNRGNGHE